MNQILRARTAAKINLTLDITGVRANGYHDLESVVHTIGLWDELEIQAGTGEDTLSCNLAELETPDNLCLRAVRLWRAEAGLTAAVHLRLNKHIPMGAGLGGGSGNAAAVLLLLQQAAPAPLPQDKLLSIAARLGADVPLFLRGGALLMRGIGDVLHPLEALAGWVVVIKPPFSISTPSIYKAWDQGGFTSRLATRPLIPHWPPSLRHLALQLGNDLEMPARALGFELDEWLQPLQEAGALGVRMTGSGSAVYGLFPDEQSAQSAAKTLESTLGENVRTAGADVYAAPFTAQGVEIC